MNWREEKVSKASLRLSKKSLNAATKSYGITNKRIMGD